MDDRFKIKDATACDVPLIFKFIKELAEHEKMLSEVVTAEEGLKEALFGEKIYAEVIIAYYDDKPIGFALFFHNYPTFLGEPGIYLEDLYVNPEMRGRGFGKKILEYLAKLAKDRNCTRLEWLVSDWNESAIRFYKNIGAMPVEEKTVFRVEGDALNSLGR